MRCGLLHLLLIVGERGRRSFSSDLDASLITAPVKRSPSTFNLRTEELIEVNLPLLFRPLMRKQRQKEKETRSTTLSQSLRVKGGAHRITCDLLKAAAKFSRNNMLFSRCRTGLFPMRQILSTEYLLSAGPLLFHTIASCREKANRYVEILLREREKGEESRDRTNRGERAPECRHIRDILACFAIFSQILYFRDATSASAF
ncbi:hypothetical protein G5I_05881 [Acromyrmex echinatior]|uniref:Uncharacterized protein n=1 Tax=Acromyrmex echinatior TaxID=103372 RepID=F4WJK2_ACREC|nr:hypothetical protein G5I_05881 [Acromyrmex echinatior]